MQIVSIEYKMEPAICEDSGASNFTLMNKVVYLEDATSIPEPPSLDSTA